MSVFSGFRLFPKYSIEDNKKIKPYDKKTGIFVYENADLSELKTERSFMDHVGATDEVNRLTALVNALDPNSPAGKFYNARLERIIGLLEEEGVYNYESIANSIYGRARKVYFDAYRDYVRKGYKLKDAENLAFKLAKTQYDKDIDLLNAEFPPDISQLVNASYAISEMSHLSGFK